MSHVYTKARILVCVAAAALAVPAGTLPAAPGGDLNAQALKVAKAEVKRCGKKYAARVDLQRHLVFVSALDEEHLARTIRLLAAHTTAYRQTLPCTRPAWNILVVLPTADDFRKFVPKLADTPNIEFVGVYQRTTHRVTSIDRGRVLRHEFTHALHHADACAARQSHPTWVREGLATLFESARITPSGLQPVLDSRLWTLQKAVRQKQTIRLANFFPMGQTTFLKQPDLSYAQARYLMYYLHHRGRLRDWYTRFKATYVNDPSGRKAFEAVLGNRTEILERQWQEWVAGLEFSGNPRRTGQGRLGLQMAGDSRGVKVTGLLSGGAAKRSGRLRVGDIITKFNGQPTRNVVELSAAIRAAGAMKTVAVELLRQGRKQTLYQPMGKPQ